MSKTAVGVRAEHGGNTCLHPQDDLRRQAGSEPDARPDESDARSASTNRASRRAGRSASQPGGQSSNFNSLADALKVATALSDQRRSLQQEIASVLDKGPRRTDPLSEAARRRVAKRHRAVAPAADGDAAPADSDGARAAPAQPTANVELLSFDFGTVVPQREDQSAKRWRRRQARRRRSRPRGRKPRRRRTKWSQPAEEPRVLPLRPATGVERQAPRPNVAPFPAPGTRDGEAALRTPLRRRRQRRHLRRPSHDRDARSRPPSRPRSTSRKLPPPSRKPALGAQPRHCSTPSSTWCSKEPSVTVRVYLRRLVHQRRRRQDEGLRQAGRRRQASRQCRTHRASRGAPPKMDRAAAELLRPMLRQWLAENMPRIVEEALRSELTSDAGRRQGSGKA